MDKLKVLKNLGEGNFGKVLLVEDRSTQQQWVVKEVFKLPQGEVKNQHNEVQVLKKMHHPNIVGYVDSFIKDHNLHIVMEFVPGGDLADAIAKRRGTHYFKEEQVRAAHSNVALTTPFRLSCTAAR